jgi:hypothetical protein
MLCRVPKLRHSAKSLVAEYRTRQSMTLHKEPLCQVPSTQHSLALGSLPSPSHSAHLCIWQRVTVVHTIILCRVPQADTRQRFFFIFYFLPSNFFTSIHIRLRPETSQQRIITPGDCLHPPVRIIHRSGPLLIPVMVHHSRSGELGDPASCLLDLLFSW